MSSTECAGNFVQPDEILTAPQICEGYTTYDIRHASTEAQNRLLEVKDFAAHLVLGGSPLHLSVVGGYGSLHKLHLERNIPPTDTLQEIEPAVPSLPRATLNMRVHASHVLLSDGLVEQIDRRNTIYLLWNRGSSPLWVRESQSYREPEHIVPLHRLGGFFQSLRY